MRQATNQADLKTGSFGEFRTGMEKVGQEFGETICSRCVC